ncbi:hypothetical protein [uncultured Psychroserpens sp.]|uniref:hypothetical protein n=1 Tax=uncultured Psychroserpens sp. TaxID=255436 RepID=UPI002616CE3B|nr:hypothetical protein [uncultured Psychroserpens sp.]
MKTQTFKLFTILALMLTTSCSVDNLQDDFENNTLERQVDTEFNSETQKDANSKKEDATAYERGANPNIEILNEIPPLVETGEIYLDMDKLQFEHYNTPGNEPVTIAFNLFYRNSMMEHFTIYSVETSTICANVERWVVNLAEYSLYGISVNDNGDDDGTSSTHGNGSDSTGGNTSNTGPGLGDINGNSKPPPPNEDSDEDPRDNYLLCFPPVVFIP